MIDNIYSISPQQINYIVELNNTGSFHKASKNCFVTQPTLSMQIKKVEELLGFTIFDRSRNPVEPTPAGKKLIPILLDIQQEYTRISVLKAKLEGSYIEQLRIGIIPTISAYLLLDVFQEVSNEMKDFQLRIEELRTEELIDALSENRIDLGIMAGPYNDSGIRTMPLYNEEILIYFPEYSGHLVRPQDLEGKQPWLLSKGNCLRTQMVHFCELADKDSAEVHWSYEGGNIDLLMKMADLNGGYTLVPQYYKVKSEKLSRLIDEKSGEYPARQVIAISPQRSYKKEAIEMLVRIIRLKYSEKEREDLRILNWR